MSMQLRPNGWVNPYSAANPTPVTNASRAALAAENYRKVLKRRAEDRFLKGLSQDYELERLDEIQEEVENEDRTVTVSPPRRRRLILPPPKDTIRVINTFTDAIVKLEVTQGGATIWTAQQDGSVAVRSGATGEIVHTIPPTAEGVTVTSLFAGENHMWIGCSDGTVKVFDHLVFIHVTEGRFHVGPVTAFCSSFDGRVFSCSDDTNIVKWDVEENSFEAMTKMVPGHTKKINDMTAYGYHLFTASDDGTVRGTDTETGARGVSYEGHEDSVTAVAVCDGSLFSSSMDKTIRVWNIDDGTCVKVLECNAEVLSLTTDAVAHRLWAGLASGTLEVFQTLPEHDFAHERSVEEIKGKGITSLKNFCSIDALKIWSLASNGVNKVWYSAINRVEDSMAQAIQSLKAIIAQDEVEMQKWQQLVERLEAVDARRRHELSAALASTNIQAHRRVFFHKWLRFRSVRVAERRKQNLSGVMALNSTLRLRQHVFSKWVRHLRNQQDGRSKAKATQLLLTTTTRGLNLVYYKKLQLFALKQKSARKRQQLVDVLGRCSVHALTRVYWRKWHAGITAMMIAKKRQKYCGTLLRCTQMGLARVYYMKLASFAKRAALRSRRRRVAEGLLSVTVRGLTQRYFLTYMRFALWARANKHRRFIMQCLLRNTNIGLLNIYWGKLCAVRSMAEKRRAMAHKANAEERLNGLRKEFQHFQHLIEEKKSLKDLEAQIEAARAAAAEKRKKLAAMQTLRDELAARVERSDMEEEERKKSFAEQIDNLMAQLKSKVINFHLDHHLITQIKDKTKRVDASKIFLEAHQNVKRVVVEMTKKAHLGVTDEWPLTDDMLHRMPSHQMNGVLTGIKTMIITFDIMDREVRDSISTDEEIVVNARWLLKMADISVAYRKKTMGRAATRIR